VVKKHEWEEKHQEKLAGLCAELDLLREKICDADGDSWANLNDQLEEVETEYYAVMQETYDEYVGDALYDKWKGER